MQPQDISHSLLVQLTSLLRVYIKSDNITIRIRRFHKQRATSRFCGFLAVAAMYACCNGQEPTNNIYDEGTLIETVVQRLHSGDCSVITRFTPIRQYADSKDILVQCNNKLHCLCQKQCAGNMIECSQCKNWFHVKCVKVDHRSFSTYKIWLGPCCEAHEDTDHMTIDRYVTSKS